MTVDLGSAAGGGHGDRPWGLAATSLPPGEVRGVGRLVAPVGLPGDELLEERSAVGDGGVRVHRDLVLCAVDVWFVGLGTLDRRPLLAARCAGNGRPLGEFLGRTRRVTTGGTALV